MNNLINLWIILSKIIHIDSQSDYPPHMWAEKSISSENTTNAYKSFYSKLNSIFYTPHPDIFFFLENTKKKIQIDTKMLKFNKITNRKNQ